MDKLPTVEEVESYGSKIIRLEAQNILRLHAVEIFPDPDKSTIVIGGFNEQGKSAVLNSIQMAIGGTKKIPPMPIHEGKSKAHVIVEFDNLVVKRVFTSKGSTITLSTPEGRSIPGGPQNILKELYGTLTFDPLEFIRMDHKKQEITLKELLGIDFTELDDEYKKVEEERRIVNRGIKSTESQIEAMPYHRDAPKDEVLTSDLLEEHQRGQAINQANREVSDSFNRAGQDITDVDGDIELLEQKLAATKEGRKILVEKRDDLLKQIDKLQDVDLDDIEKRMTSAESDNDKYRQNAKRNNLKDELEVKQAESEAYTDRLQQIKEQKTDTLGDAKFPLPGLSFGDEFGVTYRDKPFQQCSQAEQLTVSVAMGFALNPKLKILLVRDGSLLDDEHLALVMELAAKYDGQLWIERVGKGKECSVIIEDGRVE